MSLPTNLSKPNTLIAGTDALAADINGNLDYIITAQNASNTQTNTNTDEIVTARNGAASLDDRLDAADTDRNLKAYANNASLTGIPTAPTAAVDTNTTQLATTAFAKKEADDAQAFAIQRANHTGTQPQSTIDNLITDIAAVQSYSTQRANHTGTQPQSTIDNLVSDLASKIGANNAALTGVPTAPTAATGTNTTQIATTEFVRTAAFNSALPAQTGNSGKFVTTDGTNASWADILPPSIIRSARTSNTMLGVSDSTKLIDITSGSFTQTFDAAATLGNGWYCYIRNAGTGDITLDPNGAETIDGLTSYILYPNEVRLIQCDGTGFHTVTATKSTIIPLAVLAISSPSATVTIDTILSNSYSKYILVGTQLKLSSASYIKMTLAVGGIYATSNYYMAAGSTTTATSFADYFNTSAFSPTTQTLYGLSVAGGGEIGNNFEIEITNIAAGRIKTIHSLGCHETGTNRVSNDVANGICNNSSIINGQVNGIRFAVGDGGNINSGTIYIYGVV